MKPSEQRNIILQEMRTKGVDSPEQILDDPSTRWVKVKVFGNPGYTSGKILDVGIETSTECDATDLTGGKLLEARLREMAFIGGDGFARAAIKLPLLESSSNCPRATRARTLTLGLQ